MNAGIGSCTNPSLTLVYSVSGLQVIQDLALALVCTCSIRPGPCPIRNEPPRETHLRCMDSQSESNGMEPRA
jgi:hypothetical protein